MPLLTTGCHYLLWVGQVIVAIASGAAPTLAEATPASEPFRSFLAAALTKEPKERPGAAALLKLPFCATATRASLAALAAQQAQADLQAGAAGDARSQSPAPSSADLGLEEEEEGQPVGAFGTLML